MQHRDVEDIYPLSPLQEGMLFHTLYRPGSGVYVNRLALRLGGPLDRAALRAAWERAGERHPMLRSAFFWEELERPLQVVHRRVELPWQELDWSGAGGGDGDEGWRGRLDDLLERPEWRSIELGEAPLQRLALVRLGAADHLMVWAHHHLLLDGWSLGVVLGEVLAEYEAAAAGHAGMPPEPLPPAPPYGDFIAWLERRDAAADEAWWRRELAGFESATPLPVAAAPERAAPERGAPELAEVETRLDPGASAALGALARRLRITPATAIQAAWGLLLARSAGEREAVFGVTVSGRPADLAGIERAVGLFINTLPLRVAADPGAALGPWLEELHGRLADLREHEHAPLPAIQRWSGAAPGAPLFESVVVVESYPLDTGRLRRAGGLELAVVRAEESTNYPLTLQVQPGERLLLRLAYDRARIAPEEARLALDRLAVLLAGLAAADPATRLGDLPLVPADELDRLESWNRTARDWDLEAPLHRRIAAAAAATPDAVAVTAGGEHLSYGALAASAERLARRLAAAGAGRGARVGILMERSAELMVALLATLEAGAAYLPLDPELPDARLHLLVADARPAAVVAQRRFAGRLDALGAAAPPVLALDPGRPPAEPGPGAPALPECGPDDLAYVLYTSGSTGRPKGVMVPHRGIVNRLLWMQEAFGLRAGDAVLQKTPFTFDVSVWELFWPLLCGARLVMAPPGGHRDPGRLAGLIAAEGVTTIHFVPSMLGPFLAEPAAARCTSLRRVIASGEALTAELCERLHRVLGAELHNLYGPTEASVDVTHHAVPARRGGAPGADRPADRQHRDRRRRRPAAPPAGRRGGGAVRSAASSSPAATSAARR